MTNWTGRRDAEQVPAVFHLNFVLFLRTNMLRYTQLGGVSGHVVSLDYD